MGYLAMIPVFGWIMQLFFAIFLAIPLYWLWSYLGPTYFKFVPEVWLNIGFWDTVWMTMLLSIVRILSPFGGGASSSSESK